MKSVTPEYVRETLAAYGTRKDDDLDPAHVALLLSALDRPGLSLERYYVYLNRLAESVGRVHDELLARGEPNNLACQVEALRTVMVNHENYQGDTETYDDLQNADLIATIDRRKGLPITLSLLYIYAARAQGWTIHGLNLPGHFVVRMDKAGLRVILDPFNEGAVLQAADLRRLVKQALGEHAELSASYIEPVSNRAILTRLQNNIKIRMIEGEDYEGALKVVETIRLFDPQEYRLLLDAGVLYARTGQPQAAITALSGYIDEAPPGYDRDEAALLLRQIQQSVN